MFVLSLEDPAKRSRNAPMQSMSQWHGIWKIMRSSIINKSSAFNGLTDIKLYSQHYRPLTGSIHICLRVPPFFTNHALEKNAEHISGLGPNTQILCLCSMVQCMKPKWQDPYTLSPELLPWHNYDKKDTIVISQSHYHSVTIHVMATYYQNMYKKESKLVQFPMSYWYNSSHGKRSTIKSIMHALVTVYAM